MAAATELPLFKLNPGVADSETHTSGSSQQVEAPLSSQQARQRFSTVPDVGCLLVALLLCQLLDPVAEWANRPSGREVRLVTRSSMTAAYSACDVAPEHGQHDTPSWAGAQTPASVDALEARPQRRIGETL